LLNSFRNKLRIARSLSFSDWLTLVEAWWGLLGYYLVLRKISYERLQSAHGMSEGSANSLPTAQRLHRLVVLASRLHVLPMTCLVQALTLRRMLGRRGVPSRLVIGAGKTPLGIHAHAWVEVQGQSIGEQKVAERFSPLTSAENGLR
jgi:hypothetical protein